MGNEVWKDIDGFNGKYQVSNQGRVRSFSRWKNGAELSPGKCGNPGPYLWVTLVKTGRKDTKNYYIHKLVADAFLPKIEGKTEINHIDGNTLNNSVENLEWCTHAENMKHASSIGTLSKGQENRRGSRNPQSKAVLQYDLYGNLVKEWGSVNEIMRTTGIPASYIFKCCNPQKYPYAKTAKGFVWRYKDGKTDNKEKNP